MLIIIIVVLCIVALITYSPCVAASNGDSYLKCKYNILEICRGNCCYGCELQNICRRSCKENPRDCDGKE